MTQQHPITPPPELVQQWMIEARSQSELVVDVRSITEQVAHRAAQWGADQELEACRIEIIDGAGLFLIDETSDRVELAEDLRNARRPKPPSLKEQALEELKEFRIDPEGGITHTGLDLIRRALEQLPDD